MRVRVKSIQFRKGFRIPRGADAAAWRREITKIYERHGGGATARELFEDVQGNKRSPLRSFFCWDEHAGWLEWNYQLARVLQGGFVVTIAKPEGGDVEAPGAIALPVTISRDDDAGEVDDARDGKVYRLIEDVLSDEDRREQMLRQALAEFRSWRNRWETIKELAEVFAAADKVAERRKAAA